ncbi:GNAT family N-acetyltransferase [Pseudoruegeria sp. SHC-113]|uniref:GNAT family N-acetyltransferase n=1 Tax=Pseudoruegeria sp. SHC-113 TaxID=2855439 RepID=UPI0021BAA635|nr:GNAT family N-acetyltransferase [Pseudoruegeria sp. SHC-113]MCT8160196.1 GNAT family N-acetyltransferase [Pseudoruegeria sp. SHC-113]
MTQERRFRAAKPGDAAFILDLERTGMEAYAVALWGQWRPSATLETLSLAGHRILQAGARDVGCLALWEDPSCLFVKKLYIAPEARGRGHGAWALTQLTAEAQARGLPIRLNVLVTNPALRFYRREGFRVCARSPERITCDWQPGAGEAIRRV